MTTTIKTKHNQKGGGEKMKSKTVIALMILLAVPLSFAVSEQSLSYDEANNIVKISYDNLNRITGKNSSSDIANYSYDRQFQGILSNISFENSTYIYSYDDKYRVIEEKKIIDGTEFTKRYVYDSADRMIKTEFSSGQDLDFYYNHQSKINKIKNFINETHYNPLGNPLNRTYFNNKVTEFDYNPDNLRLRQIKTKDIQSLNYSYDNAGNIIGINDSVNNRTYSMSYDNLDRLTNVTINGYTWIYQFDAIGNILKIIRNNTETTSMKYDKNPVHAPYKIITTKTGVDVYREMNYNNSNKTKVVQFYLINEKNVSLTNVNWTAEFEGNNFIESDLPFNLSVKDNIFVIIEHNYSKGGNYRINLTGNSGNSSDYERIKLIFGAVANSLNIMNKNGSKIITEFTAKNTINELSINWSWDCTNGVSSSLPFNMSSNEDLLVIMEHNYSLSSPNLSCSVHSADGNESKFKTIIFDGVKISNYNLTKIDSDTLSVKFDVVNYFTTLNVNWNITSNDETISENTVTLDQGQIYYISQEINYTTGGLKKIQINIGSGNLTDSYTDYQYIKWLDLNQFYSTVKNATARVFDFLVTNKNAETTAALWNISNPSLNYSLNLSNNESLIVIIEEDYGQGNKQVNVRVFNNSIEEDNLLDVFKIRQLSIESFQTLFENSSSSIVSSIVKNNINPLNVSWRLNNTQDLISSNQNVLLNTSEQMIVVIESSYSDTGVYPLSFIVNSTAYNDNATGVSVS